MDITIELNLGIIDLITQEAVDSEESTVTLVPTEKGDIAVVSSMGERGALGFIAQLDKKVVLDYWGDEEISPWITAPPESVCFVVMDDLKYVVSRKWTEVQGEVTHTAKVSCPADRTICRKRFECDGALRAPESVLMAKELAGI